MEALVKRALRSRLEAYIVDYSSDRMVNWEIRDVRTAALPSPLLFRL